MLKRQTEKQPSFYTHLTISSLIGVCNRPTTGMSRNRHSHTHISITHRYLEDFLCVIEHLHPYGDLSSWSLGGRTQARLQRGHPEALGGAQPLSGRRRPVGGFHHGDGRYGEGLSSLHFRTGGGRKEQL